MEWTKAIKDAVEYMERHITEDITMYDVASHVNISPFYLLRCDKEAIEV